MKKLESRLKVKDVMELANKHDITLLFGQFLDDFHRACENKYELIKDEPPYIEVTYDRKNTEEWHCMLAAAVHKLANDHQIPTPEWVFDKKYIATEKYYGGNVEIPGYKEFLEETSLPEYTQRNLFYGDNVLSRI